MNKPLLSVFLSIYLICLIAFTVKEFRRYQICHNICSHARTVYMEFLESSVCSDPRQRYLFEHKNLIKCTEVEEMIISEEITDCTLQTWLNNGPMGKLLVLVENTYNKIYSYISMLVIMVFIFLCGLLFVLSKKAARYDNFNNSMVTTAYMAGMAYANYSVSRIPSLDNIPKLQASINKEKIEEIH